MLSHISSLNFASSSSRMYVKLEKALGVK